MATLSVDGTAIAEINGNSAEQLKRLASKGLGASMHVPDPAMGAAGAGTASGRPKVTCIITLEFPGEGGAR